jgi:hypothetical protein
MHKFKLLINYLKNHLVHLGLVIVFLLLVIYLSSNRCRVFLSARGIDPNFIIGFVTVIALFLSLIQNLNDKKYTYNLKLIDSIEDKGLKIISKLIAIKTKSNTLLTTTKYCIEAKKRKMVFRDLNNSLSKEDVEVESDLIAAYVDTYFPEVNQGWNDLQDKLTNIANITQPILINYEANIELIQNGTPFKNQALDNAEDGLATAEIINQEIEELTLKMRDAIVTKMNDSKQKVKNKYLS